MLLGQPRAGIVGGGAAAADEDANANANANALASDAAAPAAPPVAFPHDFFEKTRCVTSEVRFGGDIARRLSSESIRSSLAADDAFVEAPAPGVCKVTISHAKTDQVIAGVRVHVGNG